MVCGGDYSPSIFARIFGESICFFYIIDDVVYCNLFGNVTTNVKEGKMNLQNFENVYYWGAIFSSIVVFAIYFLFMRGDE